MRFDVRSASAVLVALVSVAAVAGCGGGGGGGGGAVPMTLVELVFTDEALVPAFPTGTQALPRNARLVMVFSDRVDPNTVHEQTVRVRAAPNFTTIPVGSFQVDGNRVIFDPTITAAGQPNPSGLAAFQTYSVTLPGEPERRSDSITAVVRSAEGAPLAASYAQTFSTSGGFLRDQSPPRVVEAFFLPGPDPLTKQVPGNSLLALTFDEAMDPASFVISTTTPTVAPGDTVEVRYDCADPTNVAHGVECRPIPLYPARPDPSMRTWYFEPVFSFGAEKYRFFVSVAQGVRDLAGNPLANPRSFGPFVVDGTGSEDGDLLVESFTATTDSDPGATTADWGFTETGACLGAPLTTRRAYVTGWKACLGAAPNTGRYVSLVDPLAGADQNVPVPVTPSTELGRRVLWAYSDSEIGEDGTVTGVSWGPDGNATFAARYPDVKMQVGFQRNSSTALSGSFAGNYLGSPFVIFEGDYVVGQSSNVGDEPGATPGGPSPAGQLNPLFDADGNGVAGVGFADWPAPTSHFDWDEGDPAVVDDRVLLFDVAAKEGDSFNRFRGWFASTDTTGVSPISGYPARRLVGVYEGDSPNPPPNPSVGLYNPGPTVQDMAFTLTKRVSVAQSRFYTPGPTDLDGNAYPAPYSPQRTRGTRSDYRPSIVLPAVQAGGTTVAIEFQGATGIEAGGDRTRVNVALPFTPWTTRVDDVDGFPYVRWRLRLHSNLASQTRPRVTSVTIPVVSLP
jgi:hypothetical protein